VFVAPVQIAAVRARMPKFPAMPPIAVLEDISPWNFRTWDRQEDHPVLDVIAQA